MGVLGTARVQVDIQRQVKLRTVFGLAFKSTGNNQRAETPPCEMHVAQVLLTLSSPNAEQTNSLLCGKYFKIGDF